MKLSSIVTLLPLLSLATAFTTAPVRSTSTTTTARFMFGGAGASAPKEDDPEEQANIAAAAKSMGMSVPEYQLGLNARTKLVSELNACRVAGGDEATVAISRDGNNPPKVLEITITEAGKALGKDKLSTDLCAALKSAADASRVERSAAQKNMMAYISDEMGAL